MLIKIMFFVKNQNNDQILLLWMAKVAKTTGRKTNLIHLIVKNHNASDVASGFAHEYSSGIHKTGPRAIIVLFDNICFRLVLHGRI
jgi:hypothetical protein